VKGLAGETAGIIASHPLTDGGKPSAAHYEVRMPLASALIGIANEQARQNGADSDPAPDRTARRRGEAVHHRSSIDRAFAQADALTPA
jgi:hypothetical protein